MAGQGYKFVLHCAVLGVLLAGVVYGHSLVKREVDRSITYCGSDYPPFFFCPRPGQDDSYNMCCKYDLNGTTHYDCCSPFIIAGWLIGVIVVCCVVVIALITLCLCCCCGCCGCLSASRPGYVIVR